ncbi:hypothetical protein SPFM7_00255 [Salmonella phage SPFM7]|nr:hypothetical protein SPFM7_00255 [Salmonella phage SPFM7]
MAGIMLNPPASIEMSATFYDVLGVGLVAMDEVHEHFLQRFLKEYINTAATNPVDLEGKSGELDRRGIKVIILPTVSLRDEVLVCTGVQAIYDALEIPSYVPKWLFDVCDDETGLRMTKSCMKSMVKRGTRTALIHRAASDPNRPQTIFAIQTGRGNFSMVESDPESRFYYQNEVVELTEHHPERGTPYSCTFDNYGAEKIKHILQRAAIEYAFQYNGDAYYAHIPSLRTFIFHKVFEENMHAPKMGKQHGRITTERMGVRVEVPIRQAERAILAWAPLFFCAKRGSMVEIQMTYTSRCTMT